MTNRGRLVDFVIPFVAIGASALGARLSVSGDGATAGLYLVPLALAILIGWWRPGLLGSVGAWLGWSCGVALGWYFDTGDFWLSGPAVYSFVVAFLPYAIASLLRVRLHPKASLS
jgi:hypothetical protein